MLKVLLIGCGAIGCEILRNLKGDPAFEVTHVLTLPSSLSDEARMLLGTTSVVEQVSDIEHLPDFAIECAGPSAVRQHVPPLLLLGVDVGICSTGAFTDDALTEQVRLAATTGRAQACILSGAIGGVDALAAAGLMELQAVSLTSRKPPSGWVGTAAERFCELSSLTEPLIVFRGSARDAAALFPKNANSAATVALASIGMDATVVTLIADPTTTENTHEIEASGAFGSMRLLTSNHPLEANPKTSALAALSAIRTIRNRAAAIHL